MDRPSWFALATAAQRLAPREPVYQQSRRWLDAGCFEAMVMSLRSMIRFASGRQGQPSAVVLDGRILQSSCESGSRSGYDGYKRKRKRKRGSEVHMAVDTLGHLLAVHVTPANAQERAQVFELAWADQGDTGEQPRQDAMAHGIELQVIKLAEAKKGFVWLPKRWAAHSRRLAKDCERLPDVLRGLHFLVFAILMLPKAIPMLTATGNA
jgi:transposase